VATLLEGLVPRRFSWIRHGRHLVLEGAPSNGVSNLWRLTVSGAALTLSLPERLTTGTALDTAAAASPDGRFLAYTVATTGFGLYAFDLPRRGRLAPTGTRLTALDDQVTTTDVSADGRRLACSLLQTGTRDLYRLWAVDLVSGARESLSPDDAGRRSAVWSPDGAMLAYHYFGRSTRTGNVLGMRDRSGREHFLSAPRGGGYVIPSHWTPDGRAVVASARAEYGPVSIGLWPMNRAEQAAPQHTIVAHPTSNLWQGRVSPNGRWLSFLAAPPHVTVTTIAVVPVEGAPEDRWIRLPAEMSVDKPRWSADGRSLYFIGGPGRTYHHLYRIGFDPAAGRFVGAPEQLSQFSRPDFEISPVLAESEISVTAAKVFLTMRSTSGSVWILNGLDE
jgi:Tol biopolymer transport system component